MKKITILFFVLFATVSVFAGANTEKPLLNNPGNSIEEKGCNLPAPNNLMVTNVTTNSITVQWDVVAGATGYNVAAFEPGTNNQYPTIPLFGGVNTAMVAPLPSGTPIEIRVAAICNGNEQSPNYSSVVSATDIVIEVIVAGFECPTAPNYSQQLSLTNQINYTVLLGSNAPVYKFRVVREGTSNPEYLFEMKVTDKARFHLTSGGVFGGDQNEGTFSTSSNAQTMFTFKVSSASTSSATLKISPGGAPQGYLIQISQPMCGNTGSGMWDGGKNDKWEELSVSEDRTSDKSENSGLETTISPVPFDDQLTVRFAGNKEFTTDAHIQMFTVSGALIQSHTVVASAENNTVELNTKDLLPGLFVLQIQTAQGSETKLITKLAH